MSNKPHILFISSWWPTKNTSVGTFVELHLLALQSRGCKCAILLSQEITVGNYLAGGFRSKPFNKFRRDKRIHFIENLTIHPWPLRWARRPVDKRKQNILNQSRKRIEKYIATHGKPDFIFHHGVFDFVYLSQYLSEYFGLPIWYMENSPNIKIGSIPCANPFDSKQDIKAFVSEVDRRFAVTQSYVERMQAVFGQPFELCPNVITDEFFVKKALPRTKQGFSFANVAILDERKNQSGIVQAFAKAFKGRDEFQLYIAGDGPLLHMLREEVRKMAMENQVHILGFLDRKSIVDLLDRVHCFVLNSHAETFGVVLVEAMARGIPVISTQIDGPNEIVLQSNGLFCKVNDVDDLARAMLEMAANYSIFDQEIILDTAASRYGPDAVKQALFGTAGENR